MTKVGNGASAYGELWSLHHYCQQVGCSAHEERALLCITERPLLVKVRPERLLNGSSLVAPTPSYWSLGVLEHCSCFLRSTRSFLLLARSPSSLVAPRSKLPASFCYVLELVGAPTPPLFCSFLLRNPH